MQHYLLVINLYTQLKIINNYECCLFILNLARRTYFQSLNAQLRYLHIEGTVNLEQLRKLEEI